ncbi:MAG: tetraacyldisaccharide 4'-kinase [Oligoflexia bacterium]|nr:tetraacyldisaccharide 4'-kinase [Oligoflexia bacterium]
MLNSIRSFLYELELKKSTQLPVPVISIGNISMGGTGKSPMTMYLLEWAKKEGLIPLVLTRGYKRKSKEVVIALENKKIPVEDLGDEPWMIKNRYPNFPLLVHANRVTKAKEYWSQFSFVNFAVLDDGFQHWQGYRDFDIVMVDAKEGIEGLPIPFGFFRENKQALERADLIVINRADEVSKDDLRSLEQKIKEIASIGKKKSKWKNSKIENSLYVVKAKYNASHFFSISNCQRVEKLEDKNIIAVSGIAKPESFHYALSSMGYSIKEKITYSDHASLSEKMILEIKAMSKKFPEMPIVITEKDWARWSKRLTDINIYVMCVDLVFFTEDKPKLELFFRAVRECII